MLDRDWGAGLVGTVDSSSVVRRFIDQPYKVVQNGRWVSGPDSKFDIEKYLAGEIILAGFPEPEDYEFMSPEQAYAAEQGEKEFQKKIGSYYVAVSRGDAYDSLGIPLKGNVTAEQEQTAANFKSTAVPAARTNPGFSGIPDTTAGVEFTKDSPGLVYDSSDSNVFKVGKEKTDYVTNLKTDHETDPAKVTKEESYIHRWQNYFGNWEQETRTRTVVDTDKINRNKKLNEDNKKTNEANQALNLKNFKRNNAYANAVRVAKNTERGAYVTNRDQILIADLDDEAKNTLEREFKNFYRNEKLYTWDANLGTKPDYGDFKPDYYEKAYKDVKDKYKEYEDNDDIDVTEGYGKNNWYLWHYTTYGKAEKRRGNPVEKATVVEDYLEKTPEFAEGGWEDQTDAELAFIRDRQLGLGDNITQRILNIPEINALWEEAKDAKAQGDDNRFINLGKEYYLDVDKPDEFASLFRLSKDPQDRDISLQYNVENGVETGITDMEDLITQTIGADATVDTKRFAALNQNILKDTMTELKKAKLREQELELMGSFGTYGEIFDINKTLTDSLLNDTGIGGYLPFTGAKSGFTQESLEKQFKGVTGINNEVVYNWQKWFDESIKEKYQRDLDLGFTIEEAEDNVKIQKEFAESYITDYLEPRFNESRSMNEFVEYLDVRQEEQNPFQTQSLMNAMKTIGNLKSKTFLDELRTAAAGGDRAFDSTFYFDPTASEGSEENQKYITQRDTVSSDWDQARDNPDGAIEGLSYDTTWKAQAYRYGLDINNQDQFARLHYQIKGKNPEFRFDGAEDVVNYDKVKNLMYDTILPELEKEQENTKTIFGNFIRPEEFADDMLEGLDPNQPESWQEALAELGLEGFEGTVEDLREYIESTLRTGSAEDMRAQIKYLNKKRKKPTQYLLGVEYIKRDEDYKPADKLEGDTQLYKIFQNAGYEGTENEFYDNVFPDLDPSSQALLSQAGSKDGKISIEGFGGDFNRDPFAAFAGISNITGEDSDIFGGVDKDLKGEKEEEDDSFFRLNDPDEEDSLDIFGQYKKSKTATDLLSDYTKNFKFSSDLF